MKESRYDNDECWNVARMKQGIWLLPTKRSIDKLRGFLAACAKAGTVTPGLILVQKQELAELWDGYQTLTLPPGWALYPTEADGLGDKVRELWPAVKSLDWCGLVCDDLLPQTYLWDTLLLEMMHGKNMISCDDGQYAPHRIAGAVIWGGDLMRAVGYMFPPNFWHTYVDNVWEDLGRLTGCWDVRMDVLVTHDHGFLNDVEKDRTHEASYSHNSDDERAYCEWRLVEFPNSIQRIYAMQGLKPLPAQKTRMGIFDRIKSKFYNPTVRPIQKGASL